MKKLFDSRQRVKSYTGTKRTDDMHTSYEQKLRHTSLQSANMIFLTGIESLLNSATIHIELNGKYQCQYLLFAFSFSFAFCGLSRFGSACNDRRTYWRNNYWGNRNRRNCNRGDCNEDWCLGTAHWNTCSTACFPFCDLSSSFALRTPTTDTSIMGC